MKWVMYCLLIMIFLISGCATSLKEINQNPEKYRDKEVTVKGRVSEAIAIPIIEKGLYLLDDDTASLWVLPAERVPSRGDKIKTTVFVRTGLNIAGKTYGIILEEKKK